MQETAKKLITDSMRIVGYIASKETPTPEDLQLGLDELQQMMDSWKLESLLSEYDGTSSFTLQPNQTQITVGPNVLNNIVMAERPTEILGMWVTNASNQQVPVAECRDIEFWRSWRNSSMTTTYPTYFYFQPSYPDATLELYPQPSIQMTLNIAYRVTPIIPATLNDVMSYSPGWIQALKYNLASNIALPLAVPLGEATQMIDSKAQQAKARVKRARIHPTPRAVVDPSLGIGRYSSGGTRWGYNVNADQYNGII